MATTTSARQARAMALLAATSAMAAASSATRSPGTSAGLLPARALVTRTPAQIYHLQFSTRRPTASLPATPGTRSRAKTRPATWRRTRTLGTWVGLAKVIKTTMTGAGRPTAAATRTPPWRLNTESTRRRVRAGFVERRGSDVALICLGRTRGPWAAPRGVSGRRPLGGHGARSFFVPAHIPNYY